MKTCSYTVHLLYNASDDGLILIKEGFCWVCFLVTVPWALFHRMWLEATIFACLQIALVMFCQITMMTLTAQVIALFFLALVFGYLADETRRNFLARQGYQFEEIVLEQNIDSATRRILVGRPELLTRLIPHL